MIQHIKSRVRYLVLPIFILLFSCNKEESYTIEISDKESLDLKQSVQESNISHRKLNKNWIFEKASVYGGYKSGKEYFYSQKQIDSIYEDIEIAISGNKISFSNKCNSIYTNLSIETKQFFEGKLPSNQTENDIKSFFKNEFNVNIQDTVLIFETECESPFNKILVTDDRIFLVEYGAFYFCFKSGKSSPIDNKNCKNIPVEMGSGEECLIKNTNIKSVYDEMMNLNKIQSCEYLSEPLPETEKTIEVNKEGLISVTYKWESKNKLTVEFFYAGGLTNLIIEQQGVDVKRGLFFYAD